ncbi:MAG: MFS transporter [Haliea sp.]|nr:MFS transporter [Haliea sp.]
MPESTASTDLPASGQAAAARPLDTVQTSSLPDPERHARFMAVIAFVAQNTAVGLCYGSFGVLILEFERHFAVGRAQAALAFSLVVLATGLVAPFIGSLLGRISIRPVMMSGAVLASLGFAGMTLTDSYPVMLACFGLLIGPGVSLLGNIPAITLVNNWFTRRQGFVLGLVMMPVAVTLVPLAVVKLLPVLGFEGLLWLIAAGYLAILPLLLFVVDRPQHLVGAVGSDAEKRRAAGGQGVSNNPLLRDVLGHPAFLPLVLATGLMMGAGIAKNTHMVPLLVESDWSMEKATLLLAISGGSAVIGSLLLGTLADRFNAAGVLLGNALLQMVVWLILIAPVSYPLLVLDAVLIGICLGGFGTAKAVVVVRIFGQQRFAFVSGLTGLTTLPFLFGLSPVVGLVREMTGSYVAPVSLMIGGFVISAACLALVGLRERQYALAAN